MNSASPTLLRFAYLAEHPELCEVLAGWYEREWPLLYAHAAPGDALAEAKSCLNRDRLNLTIVAFHGERLAGAASLLTEDYIPRLDLGPWLASVVVRRDLRGRGIGTALVRTTMRRARSIGVAKLNLWTPRQRVFYEKLGWRYLETGIYAALEFDLMEWRSDWGA